MATTNNNWEMARWIYIIGRSLRFFAPSPSEKTAADTFISTFLSERSWLAPMQDRKEALDGRLNPVTYYGEVIAAIGRDIKDVELRNATEKTACEDLITATGERYLGNKGCVPGSDVDLP